MQKSFSLVPKKGFENQLIELYIPQQDLKITDKEIGRRENKMTQKRITHVLCTCWSQATNVSQNFQAARSKRERR